MVFRQVLEGDVKKFKAKSNTTPSGGGARDFRFRPYEKFDAVFDRLLSTRKTVTRKRKGKSLSLSVYTEDVTVWHGPGATAPHTLVFESPTTARDGEGRICQLDKLKLKAKGSTADRCEFLILWKDNSGKVFVALVTDRELRAGHWHEDIAKVLLSCMEQKKTRSAIQGYHDFKSGRHYCKGKQE